MNKLINNMKKRTYIQPSMAVISTTAEQPLLVESINAEGEGLYYGGDASRNGITGADARGRQFQFMEEDF